MNQIEIYWAVLSNVSSIAIIGITGWIFNCLVKPFLQKCRHAGLIGITFFTIMALSNFVLIIWIV